MKIILETEREFLDYRLNLGGWAWKKIVADDLCCYCQKKIKPSKFTLEHILPISAGGHNRWDNKSACCAGCNVSRGSKPLLHYLLFPAKGRLNEWRQVGGPFVRDEEV